MITQQDADAFFGYPQQGKSPDPSASGTGSFSHTEVPTIDPLSYLSDYHSFYTAVMKVYNQPTTGYAQSYTHQFKSGQTIHLYPSVGKTFIGIHYNLGKPNGFFTGQFQ